MAEMIQPLVPVSSNLFSFMTETRLVCSSDGKIKYKQSAPETILNLRIPMEKGKILRKETAEEEDRPPTPPEQKRQKPDEKQDEKEKEVPTVTFKDCH